MALDWNNQAEVLKRRQQAIQAGYKPADVDKFIQSKREEQAQLDLVQGGALDVGDLAKTDPITASKAVKAGAKPGTKKSAEQQKKESKLTDLSSSLKVLEQNYAQVEAKGRGKGDIAKLLAGLTGGSSFGETADYEALRKGMIGPVARAISGEVGVLTDKDIARAENLLPKVTDDPKLAQRKLDNLRQLISEKGGPEFKKKETVSQPITQATQPQLGQPQQRGSSIVDILSKVGGVEAKVLGKGLDFLAPRAKSAITQGPQELARRQAARPNTKGDLLGSIINAAGATKDLAQVAVPGGVELGLLGSPLTKLGLLKGGATAGGVTGATTPGASPEERIKKAFGGALGGALTGGVLKGAGKTASALAGQSPRLINQLFKPTNSELRDLKKFSGQNFAEEVQKRDLPFIKGKNDQQIFEYYSGKVNELNDAADNFLAQSGKTISKQDLIKVVDKQIESRGTRIKQSGALKELQDTRDEILTMGDQIDAVTVNQIKRDLQTAGKAAYGPGGNPSPSSEAMSESAREINNLLDSKVPGVKDINKTIQFYNTAHTSLERKLNKAWKSEGGLISQLLTGGAGAGAVFGAATGNPAVAGAAIAPMLANLLYRSPKFKSRAASATQGLGQQQIPDFLKKLLLLQGGRAGSSF